MRKKNTREHTATTSLRDTQTQVEQLTALVAKLVEAQTGAAPQPPARTEADAVVERLARKAENRRLRAENEQEQCSWTGMDYSEKQCNARRHRKSRYCKQHKSSAIVRNRANREAQREERVERHTGYALTTQALAEAADANIGNPAKNGRAYAVVLVTPGNEGFGRWLTKNGRDTSVYDDTLGNAGTKLFLGSGTKAGARKAASACTSALDTANPDVDFEIRILNAE